MGNTTDTGVAALLNLFLYKKMIEVVANTDPTQHIIVIPTGVYPKIWDFRISAD